jgi:hypothetical protein
MNLGISQIPFLKKNEFNATQLIVHGKPFLMLAGEANNSSGSGVAHMGKTMKALKEANLNSLLVSVSWEIIEPKEGVFDFSSVDELIRIARENNGSKTKGIWSEVFGKNDDADMFFMAWHYSRYLNYIAEAGKKEYNLPMYANCWMPQPRPNPGKPGNYPSGGPILSVLDIWKAGAPSIDVLAPDLYGADFKVQVNNFHRTDNPLFIPETNTTEGPASWAFAEEDAICFSPFGIDSRGNVMEREYSLLTQLMPVITKYQGSGKMFGIFRHRGDSSTGREFTLNKDVKVSVTFSRGFMRPPSASTPATVPGTNNPMGQQNQEPASYGIFIQTGENEFMVAGYNLSVSAASTNLKKEVWLKDAWQGHYENGVWKPEVLHNGDEAGFLRSDNPTYGIRAYRTNPPEPSIFRFKVLVYDKL